LQDLLCFDLPASFSHREQVGHIAWFDGFNHMTALNPHYKRLNFHALYNNILPTIALVSTYLLQGLVVSANYVNNGMIQDESVFTGKRRGGEHHHSKGEDRWDGSFFVEQPSAPAQPFRARVVCSA
jgi:hypothetical protein